MSTPAPNGLTPELMEAFFLRYGPHGGVRAPLRFVIEILGVKPDKWQRRLLLAYGARKKLVSVRSCHGPGKTAALAWIILHHQIFFYPQKTAATAPSKDQLEDALVSEVLTWFAKLPGEVQDWFEVKKNRIELKRDRTCFFTARTSREENPEALAGIHSDFVLLIADEGSGVPEVIYESAFGSLTGEQAEQTMVILAGNPVRTSGLFFDTHNRLKDKWFTIHVTGMKRPDKNGRHDHRKYGYFSPRVGEAFVQLMRDMYGEDSNQFRVRVLGEFPRSDADSVIPYELLASAKMRDIHIPKLAPRVWGVDIGRGGDPSALVERTARSVSPLIMTWQSEDLMETSGIIAARWRETPLELRPAEILIDTIGLGAGVFDRLRELGLPVRAINVAETKSLRDNERFRDLRTELWYMCREWFQGRSVTLPEKCICASCKNLDMAKNHMTRLEVELGAQSAKLLSSGKLVCLPKGEMKKKLNGQSPNIADALVLTFASDIATLVHGSGGMSQNSQYPWNQPLPINRASV